MYYISQIYNYLGLSCEYENLGSLEFFYTGAAKVWHVIPEAFRTRFKRFTERDVFNTSYLTTLRASVHLSTMMKY